MHQFSKVTKITKSNLTAPLNPHHAGILNHFDWQKLRGMMSVPTALMKETKLTSTHLDSPSSKVQILTRLSQPPDTNRRFWIVGHLRHWKFFKLSPIFFGHSLSYSRVNWGELSKHLKVKRQKNSARRIFHSLALIHTNRVCVNLCPGNKKWNIFYPLGTGQRSPNFLFFFASNFG